MTARLWVLLGVLFVFFLGGGHPAARAQPAPPGTLDQLDAYFQEARRTWGVPGLAVAIVKDDSVVFAKGYGVRKAGTDAPVTPETRFLLASTTKAFTAAALSQLVEAGRLAWDTPVHQLLPDFRLRKPYVTRALTVRDLLTHRVGIERGDRLWWASPFDRDEVLRRMRYLPQAGGFRAGYAYNNNLYIAAGELVKAVTDTSWDAFVQKHLFAPLGMTHSTTSIRTLPADGNVAAPHLAADEGYRPIAWRNVDNLGGGGALNSTVRDMAHWLQMHLNEGRYAGRTLLQSETLEEMYAAQVAIQVSDDYKKRYPSTHFRAYGLGWFLQDHRGTKVVQHSGSLDGMRARIGMIPEHDLGAVLLTNAPESELLAGLLFRIFDRFLDVAEPLRDWSAVMRRAKQKEDAEEAARLDSLRAHRVKDTTPTLSLKRYAGTYTHKAYGTARVAHAANGRLVLHVGPHFTGPLRHWHYNTFRTDWVDPTIDENLVTFTLGADGVVEAMSVKDWAVFRRSPEP